MSDSKTFLACGAMAVAFCVLIVAIESLKPRAPETVPCKCAKCSAQCCEVGK